VSISKTHQVDLAGKDRINGTTPAGSIHAYLQAFG
jgi:hypothetical protein